MAPRNFALVCFSVLPCPNDISVAYNHMECVNELNKKLLESINESGSVYMSSTVVDGAYIIRCAIGATLTERRHVIRAWEVIQEHADAYSAKTSVNVLALVTLSLLLVDNKSKISVHDLHTQKTKDESLSHRSD
nr:tyrosine/dopa decarboxylase 5 [Quercus suber]